MVLFYSNAKSAHFLPDANCLGDTDPDKAGARQTPKDLRHLRPLIGSLP